MIIPEQKFRKLCREEYGGFEMSNFQRALDEYPNDDPVKVTFYISWNESKTIEIPRDEAEICAGWAREEAMTELTLLEHIKPQMRDWIKNNRKKMCEKLKDSLEKYNPEYGPDVQIIWPIATPDMVPFEIARKYLEKYGNIH